MAQPQRNATRETRLPHGTRRIPRSFLNDLAAQVVQRMTGVGDVTVARHGTNISIAVRRGGKGNITPPVRFLAALTASTAQAGYGARWDYTFAEVTLSDAGYDTTTDGRTGTAMNLVELSHIAEPAADQPWYVWGVDKHGDDYPPAFGIRPVGGGGTSSAHRVDVVVELTVRTNSDGSTVYTFEGMGSHDGTCT